MQIAPLAPEHAAVAAQLHMAGQPGTFLTSLGVDVLAAIYRGLPLSAHAFGYAVVGDTVGDTAVGNRAHAPIYGFVSATTSTGKLFLELGSRRLGDLLPPLLRQYVRHPRLLARSLQTLLYPFLVREQGGAAQEAGAELLSIMVAPAQRNQGAGTQLLAALLEGCRARQIRQLHVTVDAGNLGARRFYSRHGFTPVRDFRLYGRAMLLYQRPVITPSTPFPSTPSPSIAPSAPLPEQRHDL
jgi:ribosomal protein S18 acetylase RimI-like enzyme